MGLAGQLMCGSFMLSIALTLGPTRVFPLCRAPEALNPLKAMAVVAREKRKELGGGAKEDSSRKRKLTALDEIRMVRGYGKGVW